MLWNSVGARLRMVRVLEHLPLRQERDDKQGNQAEKEPGYCPTGGVTPLVLCDKITSDCATDPNDDEFHTLLLSRARLILYDISSKLPDRTGRHYRPNNCRFAASNSESVNCPSR
jgi:hypothetical protein